MKSGICILVVDDDVDIANGSARLLEKAGYGVLVANTGEEAWQLALEKLPDLVLLDCDLPGMDGVEVCRRIKQAPALAGSMVVLASAHFVTSGDQVMGLEAGADGYIARPIDNRELLARVSDFERILSLTRTLRAQAMALQKAQESALQSQMAALNLLEDAMEARQRAEQVQSALEQSTQMLELTGTIARIGGWELDLLTSKLIWTRETFRIHGLEPPEPEPDEAINFYAPDSRQIVTAAVQAAIADGTPYDLELQLVTRDGRLLWVNSRGQAEMRDGKAVRLLGSIQDISARREAKTALIASEAKARAIVDASPVPIALYDDQQRITFLNPAFTLAFGYVQEDLPSVADWWPKAYPDAQYRESVMKAWFAEIARAQASNSAFRPIEARIQCKDGAPRSVLASVAIFSNAAADGNHLVTLIDITQRKRMEKQVLQSEKLASIGLLAAGVAHEINNPIGFVNSNLGSLGRLVGDLMAVIDAFETVQASSEVAPELWVGVDAVKTRVELDYLRNDLPSLLADSEEGLRRVKRIVKGLKDFAYTSAADTWRPDDLIQGLESTLNVVWNELKYTCEVRKEYTPLPPVDCVLAQLNQVFMNLLVNAAQAIEGQGVITLRTGCQDDEVWVEVSDTGCGISLTDQARLFDPFFTTKEVGKGTGLGLSVSHGIIERHHGRIEVQSVIGEGTTMRVRLPVRQPASD